MTFSFVLIWSRLTLAGVQLSCKVNIGRRLVDSTAVAARQAVLLLCCALPVRGSADFFDLCAIQYVASSCVSLVYNEQR